MWSYSATKLICISFKRFEEGLKVIINRVLEFKEKWDQLWAKFVCTDKATKI